MAYFNRFPTIDYFNVRSRNIILKAAIVAEVVNNVTAFYPYVIPEGYRPDTVAWKQYGDPHLDWVVYFSNSIVDPFFGWPLDQKDFNAYVEKKHAMTVYEAQSETAHYVYTGINTDSAEDIARKSYKMSVETYNTIPVEDKTGWTAQSIYDYESELNDKKRSIQLISGIYVEQMLKELTLVLNKQ